MFMSKETKLIPHKHHKYVTGLECYRNLEFCNGLDFDLPEDPFATVNCSKPP